MTLPGEGEIMDMMEVADPDAVHTVRTFIRKQLASELKEELLNTVCHSLYFFRFRELIFCLLKETGGDWFKFFIGKDNENLFSLYAAIMIRVCWRKDCC